MFGIVDAEDFVMSEKISECNREILQKYFRFLRHEGNSERTVLNHMENMIWVARILNKYDWGILQKMTFTFSLIYWKITPTEHLQELRKNTLKPQRKPEKFLLKSS